MSLAVAAPARFESNLQTSLSRRTATAVPAGKRLTVKVGRQTLYLAQQDIRWVQAARNYLRIYTGQDYHLLRQTMSNIVEELDDQQFIRIHRCTLINRDWIGEVRHLENGQSLVILKDQTVLRMSRGYRHVLNQLSRLAVPLPGGVSLNWK